MAASVPVAPFSFGSSGADAAKWDKLMKYKLWAEGSGRNTPAITFESDVHITDTVGFVGSPKGGLQFINDQHSLGGPLLFAGNFTNANGRDTIMTGPFRFATFTIADNSRHSNYFYGPYCVTSMSSHISLNHGNAVDSCAIVPPVDSDLSLPTVNNHTDSISLGNVNHNGTGNDRYIHVPPGSTVYDVGMASLTLANEANLYVAMPPGGRPTRIFISGNVSLSSKTSFKVIYAKNESQWSKSSKTWSVSASDAAKNSEYNGDLLVYFKNGVSFPAGDNRIMQGTLITSSDIRIQQHMSFAGQLIAKSIYINSDFKADQFRYVPFDPPVINSTALASGSLHEGKTGETLNVQLDKAPSVPVTIKYCIAFDASANVNQGKTGKTGSVITAAAQADLNTSGVPLCSNNGSKSVTFKSDGKSLVTPITLTATDDALAENTEFFYLRILDITGGVLENGARSGDFKIYIEDNDSEPSGKDTTITTIVSSAGDSIGYEDVPFKIESFPAYYKATSNINNVVLTPMTDYKVQIVSAPTKGSLKNGTTAVGAGSVLSSADIKAGKLTYVSGLNEFGDSTTTDPKFKYSTFTYRIVDDYGEASKNTFTMTIAMNPVNDKPEITNAVSSDSKLHLSVKENSAIGVKVGTITAQDSVDSNRDLGNTLTYKLENISGNPSSVFQINSKNGAITVKAATLDYEKQKTYEMRIIVTDNGVPGDRSKKLTDTVVVHVDVQDQNDPPVILRGDTTISVREHAPKDSVFIGYKATDEDAGQHVTFRMESADGATSLPFTLVALTDSDSAYIKVVSINYETQPTVYNLRIIADDGAGGSATSMLTINILDVNETPTFAQSSYEFSINEKYKGGDLVGQVTAADKDTKATPKTVLTYSLVGVNDVTNGSTAVTGLFTVNSSTGEINVDPSISGMLGQSYANHDYEVTVKVTDNGKEQNFSVNKKNLSRNIKVAVHIGNVNDPPVFDKKKYTFNVNENTPLNTRFGSIKVTDEDEEDGMTLSIITSSIPFTIATVKKGEYKLSVNGALDFETKNSYSFKVRVTDGVASDTADVVVKINDVNEKPVIADYTFNVDENSPKGKTVGTVKVKDVDTWTVMKYELKDSTKNIANVFTITPASSCDNGYFCGDIKLKDSVLDFEKTATYYMYVIATDNGKNAGFPPDLADTAVLKVHINDKNDPPTFDSNSVTVGVDENSPVETLVGSVSVYAKDEDNLIKKKDTLVYSLIPVSKNSTKFFKIDSLTGEIKVAEDSLDYESVAVYQVKVRVTDNRDPQSADTMLVIINVNDVNEKPTVVQQKFDIDELEPVGSVLNGSPVKDGDLDTAKAFKMHKYFAIDGDTAKFAIDSLTGEITTKEVLTYSNTGANDYSLTVQVVDYSVPSKLLVVEEVMLITVNDVNKAPVIAPDSFVVKENSPESTFVGKIQATDDEDAPSQLTFALVGTSKEFDISTDGIITVKKGANIDYERTKSYTLQVEVADLKGLTSIGKVKINVENVPEPPVLEADTFHVAETAVAKTLVGKAIGMDQEDADSLLTYTLIGTSEEFEVSTSGRITVKKSGVLDYESTTSYILEIYVTDTDSLSDTARFLIIVDDVNEAPEIEPAEFHVAENSPAKTKVGTVVAHDAEDPDSVLVFSLAEKSNEFEITSSGRITVKSGANLDYETKNRYDLKVSVTDTQGASSTATVKILIDDIREIPTIDDTTIVIREDAKPDTTFAELVIDNPEGDKAKVTLITQTKVFKVSEDGKITLIDTLDYESKKVYELVVTVEGDDGSIDTAHVTIKVQNVVEVPEVKITRASDEDSLWLEPDTIFTNSRKIDFEWTVDKKLQPDTTVKFPKDSTYIVKVCYDDPTKDKPGCDSVVVIVDNSIPKVTISKTAEDTAAISNVTIVEQVDENDTNFYVNHELNEVRIHIKDKATGTDSTFNTNLRLDSLLNIKGSLSDIKKVSKKNSITMDDAESAETTRNLINNNTYVVSFEKKVDGKTVKVSYNTDKKGNVIKNDDGDVVMTVEYQTVVGGRDVTVSYKVNGTTGKLVKDEYGGSYEYSYDFDDDFGGHVGVRYSVDEDGEIVKNEEGNYGYQVSYTYKNKFGNVATKNIFIVVDKVVPVVKITSPENKAYVRTRGVTVVWTVDGEVQDTLGIQGLKSGLNTIVRTYRDKAGNEASDTIFVVMKSPKDVNVHVVKPVTIINADSVEKYYGDNPPKDGQSFAVSLYNPYKDKESKVLVGGSFGKKEADGEEPYAGLNGGHLGPTLAFDFVSPRCGENPAAGLCTLDDLLERDGLIALETGGGWDREKVTVDEYVNNYCTDEFRKEFKGDMKTANLYKMTLHVSVWIYTNLGGFLNEYHFKQEINDPDYVDEVGQSKMFFELSPDLEGDVHTADGRKFGTGAYVFKTSVKSVTELRCKLPDEEIGHKRYASDELLKSFGYKRPKQK